MPTLDDAFAQLWRAMKSTIPLNPTAAIYQAWRSNYADWGSPVGPETELDSGGVFQVFTHAVVTWNPDQGVQVVIE